MSGFEHLHAAVQHHVVNSMGWRNLRPLQDAAVAPILAGEHALLVAGTASGKTEAALLPVFSRMLAEDWRGLSVVYVCPIKALLNNLEPRLARYAEFFGRRAALWHGDTGPGARRRITEDPPDILLTTPESLEAMLIFRREERQALFGAVRTLVVDELHAFAGDFRGWHLLAVAERVGRAAGRDLQRIGLSATVGNPAELLEWLAGSSAAPRRVVAPPADTPTAPDLSLDYVGSVENAALVLSRLHRGEKRLVFCDSRSRVEQLSAALRRLEVRTFVSHSSLSLDERRQAEAAFQEARDCVIVATSTLELGLDVGDLDRVVQIDAPTTVASFLQRLGRTGRRPGTARNCLFLATNDDSFLRAAGLLQLWSKGWVEPVTPPSAPFHILAQQLLALALEEGTIGRRTWSEGPAGTFARLAKIAPGDAEAIVEHLVRANLLFEEAGLLSMGDEGERTVGRKNFIELCSVFSSPPLFLVLHGNHELGQVHSTSFQVPEGRDVVLLLAGRSWLVRSVDWARRIAHVEASQGAGRSRWQGTSEPLHFELTRAMRRVLVSGSVPVTLTRRAEERLALLRTEHSWLDEEGTLLSREGDGSLRWWTFAGLLANRTLAEHLPGLAEAPGRATNFFVRMEPSADAGRIVDAVQRLAESQASLSPPFDPGAVAGLKFSSCLPDAIARRVLEAEADDGKVVSQVVMEGIRVVSGNVSP